MPLSSAATPRTTPRSARAPSSSGTKRGTRSLDGAARGFAPVSMTTARDEAVRRATAPSSAVARAHLAAERELQRHAQGMVHLNASVLEARDAVDTARAALDADVAAARDLHDALITSADSAAASPPRPAPPQGQTTASASIVDASDARAEDAVAHRQQAALRHADILRQLADAAAGVVDRLAEHHRRVSHVVHLVDRAVDVDMQCLAAAAGGHASEVLVGGSPAYPGLTVADAPRVVADVTQAAVAAGRVRDQLRRAMVGVRAATEAGELRVQQALKTSDRLHSAAVELAVHEARGVAYEAGRLETARGRVVSDIAAVEERRAAVERTLRMRAAAANAVALGPGPDRVVEALREETRLLDDVAARHHARLAALRHDAAAVESTAANAAAVSPTAGRGSHSAALRDSFVAATPLSTPARSAATTPRTRAGSVPTSARRPSAGQPSSLDTVTARLRAHLGAQGL